MHGWFQVKWPEDWLTVHITAKQLVPVVITTALWGHRWRRSHICFCSDNMATEDLLKKRTSKQSLIMHLLRCLVFYAAFFRFQFTALHEPGTLNAAADAISRNNILLFVSLTPQVAQTPIPQLVLKLLVLRRPDWGSENWTRLFADSLSRRSRRPISQPTAQGGSDT